MGGVVLSGSVRGSGSASGRSNSSSSTSSGCNTSIKCFICSAPGCHGEGGLRARVAFGDVSLQSIFEESAARPYEMRSGWWPYPLAHASLQRWCRSRQKQSLAKGPGSETKGAQFLADGVQILWI